MDEERFNNIFNLHMLREIVLDERWVYPLWQSLPIIPSDSAMNELFKHCLSLDDVKGALEEGYDCSEGKRREGTFQRCLRKGGRILKVVVALSRNHALSTDCWVVTHVGSIKNK